MKCNVGPLIDHDVPAKRYGIKVGKVWNQGSDVKLLGLSLTNKNVWGY